MLLAVCSVNLIMADLVPAKPEQRIELLVSEIAVQRQFVFGWVYIAVGRLLLPTD
jgi:hypothetical protein